MRLELSPGKSGTREVALSGLMFWAFLTCSLWFWKDKNDIQFYREIYIGITNTIWLFATAAFIGNMAKSAWDAYSGKKDKEPT